DGAITSAKITDGSVTAAKLAAGVIPTSLPPNGSAGGDLTGSYPTPLVSKLRGVSVNTTAPVLGQVLKFDGAQWSPGTDNSGAFTLPYSSTNNSASDLLTITNNGTGVSIAG